MESLIIQATKKTPEVSFNTNGELRLKGRSIPEDPTKFFDPLYIWVVEYCACPQEKTVLNIELEYFNSGTSKALLHFIREIVNIKNNGYNVTINWHYEEGDDDIYERGEYYSSILETKFVFVELKG